MQSFRDKSTRPPEPGVLHAAALLHQGRLADAAQSLWPLLAANPNNHAALHLQGLVALAQGDLAQAVAKLQRASSLQPRSVVYAGNLANALLRAEQFAQAATHYRHVLRQQRDLHIARFGLGMALLGSRDFAGAAKELEAFVAAAPDHVDGQLNLGAALSELGRHAEALPHLQRAASLHVRHAPIRYKLGLALLRAGQLPQAIDQLRRAVALDPRFADAHFQLGVALDRLGHLAEAEAALKNAVALRPDLSPALHRLGEVYNQIQEYDAAASCFERGLAHDRSDRSMLRGLARTRNLQGRGDDARGLIAGASDTAAGDPELLTLLGVIEQAAGRFGPAEAAFRQALATDHGYGPARLYLALLPDAADPDEQTAELERLAADPSLDHEQSALLSFALGRQYERQGRHDEAFARYQTGNDLRRAQCPPAPPLSALADRLIATYGADRLRALAAFGHPSEQPVFVIGMMRSGTTLVEQILSSHPDAHGHGELSAFPLIVQSLPALLDTNVAYPDCVDLLDRDSCARIAGRYLARLQPAARGIDKMPQNFEHIGLIAALFPNARIVHCVRDPMDTCISNYFHDFGQQNGFTCDLASLGDTYRGYARLMAHWDSVLPGRILHLPYEALVADLETWSRRLIDFVGLGWDERCLAFHRNERAVHTYSQWQVRQPIYSSSIGRWKHYARHLGPLRDALGTDPAPQRMAGRLTQSAPPASPPPFPEMSAYAGSAPSCAPSPH